MTIILASKLTSPLHIEIKVLFMSMPLHRIGYNNHCQQHVFAAGDDDIAQKDVIGSGPYQGKHSK